MSEPTIRPYEASDEDEVIELWSQASRQAHPFVEGEGTGLREEQMRTIYLIEADNWVAQTGAGRIVGLLGLLGNEIGGLFVHPDAQGLRIGRQLVEHAINLHGEVTVEVYELNERAVGFYRHMGFRPDSQKEEPDTGLTLLTLRRPYA